MQISIPGEWATMPKITEISSPDKKERREMSPLIRSAGIWLYCAAAGLFVLSGAAAAVSFTAQYRLVYAARHPRAGRRPRGRDP
jgi:hypothetical protein